MMPLSYARPLCALLACLMLTACLRIGREGVSATVPLPVGAALESRTPDYRVPERSGQLTRAQVDSIAPRIRALRADPTELAVAVGDTVHMPSVLRVFALDSAGTVLGELPSYDFAFSGRGMRLLASGRFVFSRPGRMRFTPSLHEFLWRGRATDLPEVTVAITVYRSAP
jgi:hypothetical protein